MKKIHLIIPAFLLFTAAGCKKILEVTPESSITEETYFKNEGDFEPYVTGIYTHMRGLANNITYGTERSEELVAASNSRFGTAWSQIITPSSGAVNYNENVSNNNNPTNNNWYRGIGHCNLLLERIAELPFFFTRYKKKN